MAKPLTDGIHWYMQLLLNNHFKTNPFSLDSISYWQSSSMGCNSLTLSFVYVGGTLMLVILTDLDTANEKNSVLIGTSFEVN